MNALELNDALKRMGACYEARKWANGKSLTEVYEQLHRADWWLWLAVNAGVDRKRLVLTACACARTALRYVPGSENRPERAIEMAERWARGDQSVTLEDVQKAARDAYAAADAAYDAAAAAYDAAAAAADAAYAAYDAYAAADAAYAAADAAYAAYAAYAAADAAAADAAAAAADAAYAAYAAADAAYDADAARKKALADLAPMVKEHLPLELVASALAARTPAESSSP